MFENIGMFDLFDECGKDIERYGYSVKEIEYEGALGYMKIESEEKSQELSLKKGEYFIINIPSLYEKDCEEYLSKILYNSLCHLINGLDLKKHARCLVVGLGNPNILADSLGKSVIDSMADGVEGVYKFCPNIYAITGIDTSDFVLYVKEGVKADCVIVVDSLATNDISRLGTSVQLTSAGISAGSGVRKNSSRIDKDKIGVPCISIGVPYMIFSSVIKKDVSELLLTPKDIHTNIQVMGKIIACAIDKLFKGLL